MSGLQGVKGRTLPISKGMLRTLSLPTNKILLLKVNSGEIFCSSPGSLHGSWTGQPSSPERTTFTVVPAANDLCQYSVSHPSQMAKATSRLPHRIGSMNLSDHPGRPSPFPHHGSPQRQFPAILPQANGIFEYEGTVHGQTSLNPFVPTTSNHYETGPGWQTTHEGTSVAPDASFQQRLLADYSGISYDSTAFPTTASPNSSFFNGLPPAAANLPVSEGLSPQRFLPNPTSYSGQINSASSLGHNGSGNFSPPSSHYAPEDNESDIWPSSSFYSDRGMDQVSSSCNGDNAYPASPTSAIHIHTGGENILYPQSSSGSTISSYSEPSDVPLSATMDEVARPISGTSATHVNMCPTGLGKINAERSHSTVVLDDTSSQSVSQAPDAKAVGSRHYRLLQPQPQRYTRKLPSLTSSIESKVTSTRKTPNICAHQVKLNSGRAK